MGFLPKPYNPTQFLAAVDRALREDVRMLGEKRCLRDVRKNYQTLTAHEREVFAAVTTGMLNKQVAFDLGICENTIKVHRARVMSKMNATALPDLVRMADLLKLVFAPNASSAGAM